MLPPCASDPLDPPLLDLSLDPGSFVAERLFSLFVRRARGSVSQAEIAASVGISQPAWAIREAGSSSLGEVTMRSTAHAVGMSLEEFLLNQLGQDEENATLRQALRRAETAARARRESGVPEDEHLLARVLNNVRIAHGVGVRKFREKVPGVDRALSQKSEIREVTVEKTAAVFGLTVHEVLCTGLLYDPAVAEADKVDRVALRARLDALVTSRHPEARQRIIAQAVEIHESQMSRFRRAADPRGDVLSEDAVRRLDKFTRDLERKLKPELEASSKGGK